MKKVLASVLAGSMVLGMAAAASAATSLTLKSGTGDYDYQLYLYTPDGTYQKDQEKSYAMTSAVERKLDLYKSEYKKFMTLSNISELTAYADRAGSTNVFAAYIDLYTEADGALSPVNPSPADVKDDLKLENVTSNILTGKVFADFDTATKLKTEIATESQLEAAKAALDDYKISPTDIATRIEALGDDTVTVWGDGEYEAENKSSVDIADAKGHYMYTYGTDDAKEVDFEIIVKHNDDFRVDVASGNVTVSRKRVEADTTKGIDRYKVTVKAAAGVRDFELDDFKVELDLSDANRVYYIEGEVAYSDYRDVLPDERYIINKSDTNKLHDDGCVFNFDEVIDEETRIVCDDYVDLLFKGNYGTDYENLRVMTDDITEVEDFFQDYDIDYYDFIGTPKFAKDITVRIDADSDAYIYEYDKKTGDVVDITDEAEYTSDGMTFKRKSLKTYVVLEEPYEGGNVKAEKEPVAEEEPEDEPEETETPDDKDATGSKPNPGTGAYPLF